MTRVERTRAQSVRVQKVKEPLLILAGLLVIVVLVGLLLVRYSQQVNYQPTQQQENALFQEANRRLNRDGLVEEYQHGWRGQK